MKPRHLAQIRMSRAIPGETAADPRALPARLDGRREREVLDSEAVGQRQVELWDHRPVRPRPFLMPELGRPTPLLKRLVRHPISMQPDGPRRVDVFDASRPDRTQLTREPVELTFRLPREARERASFEPHAPEARELPFARRRAADGERSDEHRGRP